MELLIRFALSNFTLTFFILSILFACLALALKRKPLTKATVAETLFAYFLLFNIGFSNFYNFIMHVFYGNMAAQFIGWAPSPFQAEVGFASLGFAVVGIISFWSKLGFRAATIIAPALFLWGAAAGHIYQIISTGNLAPGNAGIMLWSDLLLPVIGFILLGLQYWFSR